MRFFVTTLFLVLGGGQALALKDNRVHHIPPPLANPQPPPYAINGTICSKLIPGLARMAQGVDISALDLFPSDISGTNGFKQTIFDYTCNEKRPWVDATYPADVYDIPDQVQAVVKVPAGNLNIKTRYNEKMEQFKDSMGVKVDLDMSYGLFGAFSASAGYKETKEKLIKTDKSVSETSATVSAFEVDLKSKSQMYLSQYFTESVAELPSKYSDDPSTCDNFVRTFGTHYFEVAKFGGYLYEKTIIENSYLETASQRDINLNLAASFKMFIKVDASGELNQLTEEARKEFTKNSELSFYHYGGQKNSDPNGADLEEWWKTVGKDPWLFGGQVRPIESLIENDNKRKAVQTAVFMKLSKLYLGDLQSAFTQSGLPMTPEVKAQLKRYEEELRNPTITGGSIEDINKSIKEIFADLQHALDLSKSNNNNDVGSKFAKWIMTVQDDTTCKCARGNARSLRDCMRDVSLGRPGQSQCQDWYIRHAVNADSSISWAFTKGQGPEIPQSVNGTMNGSTTPVPLFN